MISRNSQVGALELTLHRERDEVSARLRTFLGPVSVQKWASATGRLRTLDQSSISSSPAVVLMMALPLVGRAMVRKQMHVTRRELWIESRAWADLFE